MSESVREWTIRICFVVIVGVGVWTVFGDELSALFAR
jgi:hypothetical protein